MKTSLESEILFRTIQFADCMKRHNKKGKSLDVWLLICTFGTQISLGIIMCWKLAMGGGMSSVWIELPAMLMACAYSISFCNLYTVIEGRKGNISQSLCESICRMPFSLEEYYKEIGNRMKKKAVPVGMAQFAILLLLYALCLSFWKRVDAGKVHSPQKAAEFFMVLGICVITVAATFGAMAVGYYIQRSITFKIYYAFLNNTYKKKKIRKRNKKDRYMIKYSWHLFIISMILFISTRVILNLGLAVPDEIEVYRVTKGAAWMFPLIVVCSSQITDKITKPSQKEGWKLGMIVLVVCLFYALTFYETYYEDRIEVRKAFYVKEYKWEDVQSYTVKGAIGGDLRIELQMEDDNLSVIRMDSWSSKKHDEYYWSDYCYGAYLVKKLDALGIPATVKNWEKIEKYASHWVEEEEQEAVREIKSIIFN